MISLRATHLGMSAMLEARIERADRTNDRTRIAIGGKLLQMMLQECSHERV